MSLKDKGFRFYISPDKKDGRWIHPVIQKALHKDWVDVTDMPSEELVEFLQKDVDTQS